MERIYNDSDLQVLADIFNIKYDSETFRPVSDKEVTKKAAMIFAEEKTAQIKNSLAAALEKIL